MSFVFWWANAVITAVILSGFGVLGAPEIYFLVSALLSIGLYMAASMRLPAPSSNSKPDLRVFLSAWRVDLLRHEKIFIVFVCSIALSMLVISLVHYPDLIDATRIKLARIYFYLQSGSLLPSPEVSSLSTMFIFPFNAILAQLFFIIYGQNGHLILFFGFINWIVLGLALYLLCREFNISTKGIVLAVGLFLTTQSLMYAGSSESDDLLSATPFIIGAYFFIRWLRTVNKWDAAVAGLAIGLSLGVKYFPLFFLPGLAMLLTTQAARTGLQASLSWFRVRLSGFVVMSIALIAMLSPELVTNYLQTGSPLKKPRSVAAYHLNTDIYCGFRHLGLNLVELTLDPIAQVIAMGPGPVRSLVGNAALRADEALSGVEKQCYGDPFTFTYMVNSGRTSGHIVWYGAYFYLLVISGIMVARSRIARARVGPIAIMALSWFVILSGISVYWAGVGRYYMMGFALAVPVVGMAVDLAFNEGHDRHQNWFKRIIVTLAALSMVLALFGLAKNLYRMDSVNDMVKKTVGAQKREDNYSGEFYRVIRSAHDINFFFNDLFPIYDVIRRHPDAHYSSVLELRPEKTNFVILPKKYDQSTNWHADYILVPVKSHKRLSSGFLFVEQVYRGYAFANNLPEDMTLPPMQKWYLLLGIKKGKTEKEEQTISIFHFGAKPEMQEGLEFRDVRETRDGHGISSAWSSDPRRVLVVTEDIKKWRIEVRIDQRWLETIALPVNPMQPFDVENLLSDLSQ